MFIWIIVYLNKTYFYFKKDVFIENLKILKVFLLKRIDIKKKKKAMDIFRNLEFGYAYKKKLEKHEWKKYDNWVGEKSYKLKLLWQVLEDMWRQMFLLFHLLPIKN